MKDKGLKPPKTALAMPVAGKHQLLRAADAAGLE